MKYLSVPLAIVLALTIAFVPTLESTPDSAAKKKTKTVTRNFSNGTSVTIPDEGKADPYPLEFDVSGFKKGKILDVNLTLRGFSHEHAEDVDMLLVAPGGKNATVFSEVGGANAAANVTITLDDQAANPLTTDPLTSGSFQPTDLDEHSVGDEFPDAPTPSGQVALSTFNNGNPNGTWQLFIFDNASGDVGSLDDGAQLTIKAKVKNKKKKK